MCYKVVETHIRIGVESRTVENEDVGIGVEKIRDMQKKVAKITG